MDTNFLTRPKAHWVGADRFTGEVWIDQIAHDATPSRLRVYSVHFTPGSRTAWHRPPTARSSIERPAPARAPMDWADLAFKAPGLVVFIYGLLQLRETERPGQRIQGRQSGTLVAFERTAV
jgi:hypothetical protein